MGLLSSGQRGLHNELQDNTERQCLKNYNSKTPKPKSKQKLGVQKPHMDQVMTKLRIVVRWTFAAWWVTTLKLCLFNPHSYSVAMYVFAHGLTC